MKYFRFKLISLDSTECIPEHHHENFCSAPLASLELICDALILHSIPMHLSVSARYILEVIVAPARRAGRNSAIPVNPHGEQDRTK